MLAPPEDLTGEILADALARGWALTTASMAYRPVGWGSHHWQITDGAGTTWFVTVDDLAGRRTHGETSVEPAYDRLRASLSSAVALKEAGRSFVVAPIPTLDDQPLVRARDYAVSLYPFVEGESFGFGEFAPDHARCVLDMLVEVHNAPIAVRRNAYADDFTVPHRDALDAVLRAPEAVADRGPYSLRMADLIASHADAVRELLGRYDDLAGMAQTGRMVLTHGEPHPGNTMLTTEGWRLIDWDTVLIAPPERDLWGLPSQHDAYAQATGIELQPAMLDLYRLRWTIADIAVDVNRFRRDHTAGPDDDTSWDLLRRTVTSLRGGEALP